MARIKFMNIEIDNLTMDEAIQRIDELIEEDRCAYVVTPNLDHIVRLENDEKFRRSYENADLVLTDGMPLIWISKLYKTPIKEKISGSDLFPKVCELAEKKEYKLFLLGAAEGVAQKAAESLVKRLPNLNVCGVYSPPMGFENNNEEIEHVIAMIREASPHILIVCLGAPKQEKFIYDYRKALGVPVSLGLGASLDFETGRVRRAPRWMSECGLEWLFRIIQEPQRMIRRYSYDALWIIPLIKKYKQNRR